MGLEGAVAAAGEGSGLADRPVVRGSQLPGLGTGLPWQDLSGELGAWQTVHRRYWTWSLGSTWDRRLAARQTEAAAAGEVDW